MTDKQLYSLCKKYGRRALEARRKFAGLLPEVARRRLYEKRGFGSVYEFAARLGGLNRDQVDEVLRLEKRFENLTVLRQALVAGEVSAGKLSRVASVVTEENAGEILGLAKNLSYAALNIKVQEIKIENGLLKAENQVKSLCAQTLELSREVAERLEELRRKGVDIDRWLMEMLDRREADMALEEAILEEKMSMEIRDRSRYVPKKVRQLIGRKYGDRCAVPGCGRRAEQIHHLRAFALGGSNAPGNLRPLCKGHHQLEHLVGGRLGAVVRRT